MKRNYFLLLFLAALVTDLVAIAIGNREIQFIAKPLIVTSLLIHYLFLRVRRNRSLPYWIVFALVFSLAGDVLLLFDADPDYFLAGLSCFLLAHLSYIIFFYQLKRKENIRTRLVLIAAVGLYYFLLVYILYPRLAEMKMPVILYGLVISTMFVLALHLYFLRNKMAGQLMLLGAALFVLSDSLLAFNKFYQPFMGAGLLIITTYAAAQYFIVAGSLGYFQAKEK